MKTKCPICETEHEWNSCQDYYPTCEEQVVTVSKELVLTLFICPCKAVLSVFVNDERGGGLYVSCEEEQ